MMKRRMVLFAMLSALLGGCATHTVDVVAPVEEAEPAEPTEAAEPVKPVEEVAPVKEIEPKPERTTVMILMKTSKGDITLELDKEKAPKTVENFLTYVESGHYTGTIFHRVIGNFMIQGGGFDENMRQKPAPNTVENEAGNGLSNDLGTIAMARTSDPHSAGAQFFINTKDNAFLNHSGKNPQGWGYCVFGKVVEGMDVVKAIEAVPTGAQDVPKESVTIIDVSVVE